MVSVRSPFLRRSFRCRRVITFVTTVLSWQILIQVGVTSGYIDMSGNSLPTTETRLGRECLEPQCGEGQVCVEGICQCLDKNHFVHSRLKTCHPRQGMNESCVDSPEGCYTTLTCIFGKCDCPKTTEFYHPDEQLCLQRRSTNGSCKGYLNECVDHLTCINGTCNCDENSVFYDPYTQSCRHDFYKDANVRLLDTPIPIVKGEQVNLLCHITLVSYNGLEDRELIWSFNNRTIDTNKTKMFRIVDSNRTNGPDEYIFNSTLMINRFGKKLTGTYKCSVTSREEQRNTHTVGMVPITRDIFEEPEVYLEPSYLYVEKDTSVTVYCRARQVNVINFTVAGSQSKVNEVFKSKDKFITESFSFTPRATSYVRCIGELLRDGANAEVASNEIVIHLFSKGDITCPESEDRRGIKWTIAKAPSVVHGACPKGYTGYSTRECSTKERWKKTNFTNCLRKDLEEIGQEVEMLEVLGPSEEEIEDICSKLSQSMSEPESMMLSDVSQTVDILASVSNTLTMDDSDKPMVSTTSLENIADVTNQLLSTDQSDWESVDQPEETVEETRKMKRMGAKLLMAMDSLAVASLKESKLSSRTIIKRNIVIKRNQAESNRDINFPEKSDRIIKELDDWIDGSQNAVFLSSDAFPVSAENLRYSVLLYKGFRQRISSRDKLFGNKEVQSSIVAFSLNQKMKRLSPGLVLTFGVPTENFSEPVCGFLDTGASELGIWSTEGCTTQQLGSGLVKCTCNHLTNFAVLVSPSRVRNSTHDKVLSIISICGCSISVISLLALIIIYAILWKHMKRDRKTYLHLALSITLLLVYVIFLAGIERSSYEPDCTITAGALHYLLLAVFCLMLCEGVEVLMAVLYVFPSSFPVWRLLLPAFGVPLIIVGITLAITQAKEYRRDELCWLSLSSGSLWAFVAPALVVLLVNLAVMCITLRILLRSTAVKGRDNLDKTKLALKSIAILSPVLGLTWLFGIPPINSYTTVFQYLFALCNTLQGLAIFFFYCLSFYQVKDAFKVMRRKHKSGQSESETQTPSLSKSRVRDTFNVFRRKQKGSYNVENAAFLSSQPKSSSTETDQKEPATPSKYEVNPRKPTTTPITFTNDMFTAPSAVTEQESVFIEPDMLDGKDAEGKM